MLLSNKTMRVLIDDNLLELGLKEVVKPDDIVLYTGAHGVPKITPRLVIDGPGEYEVGNLSVVGVAARAHIDEEGSSNATLYKMMFDDTNYLITGHLYPDLNDDQLEIIGMVDVMVVPVGGNGYTLDPIGALQLIKKIEPKIVIPTHYAEDGIAYPVPQQALEQALKAMGMEVKEPVAKFRYKAGDLGNTTQLVVLARNQ